MVSVRTLDQLDVAGKRVLVRADLNVPMENGMVGDRTRLTHTSKTLLELAGKGAKVIVLAHFGRPKGGPDPKFTLKPVADALAETLGRKVAFATDCVGPVAEAAIAAMAPGDVLVLENTRFYPEEEKNDEAFVRRLAALGDLFVNDAFSCAHRAHASTEGLARVLPSAAGRGMAEEIDALERALERPNRPVVAIVGGSKISTKLDLLGNLVQKVDCLVIGGGMANTFLAAQGKPVGTSLCEHDLLDTARKIMAEAKLKGCEILLPSDVVIAKKLEKNADAKTIQVSMMPPDAMILDVGSDTIAEIARRFEGAKTVVWNGPLGAFEFPPFDTGTSTAARLLGMLSQAGKIVSVAGGGDTVAALNHAAASGFTFVSTAGGAFLEWLEGRTLPGVAVLQS